MYSIVNPFWDCQASLPNGKEALWEYLSRFPMEGSRGLVRMCSVRQRSGVEMVMICLEALYCCWIVSTGLMSSLTMIFSAA